MTPSNKGNYIFCENCIHRTSEGKYPCELSHRKVRGKIDKERNFKVCLELKIK